MQRRKNEVFTSDESIFDEQRDYDYINDLVIKEEHAVVFKSMHTLSSMYRDIIVDFYIHCMPMSAIADKHGISLNTVKCGFIWVKKK